MGGVEALVPSLGSACSSSLGSSRACVSNSLELAYILRLFLWKRVQEWKETFLRLEVVS